VSHGTAPLQVTRTLRGQRFPELPRGETGIFESYVRALEAAQDFVYLENQYLTCIELVDAIVTALLARPNLQVIALLNTRLGIPGYDDWQRQALDRLIAGLGGQTERVGLFTLWSHEARPAPASGTVLLRTYVHSKLAIIDDEWLSLGSANLDGLSLVAGEHALRWPLASGVGRIFGLFGGGDARLARSTEVNVTCAALPGQVAPPAISQLRRDLWAEHLGFGAAGQTPGRAALDTRPEGGWLSVWRELAGQKVDGLRQPEPRVSRPRILPYPLVDGRVPSGISRSRTYLKALDIDVGRIEVREEFRSFDFERGRWR
jgi:hypothetical protein